MTGSPALDLIGPTLVLAALGWAVPRLLFHVFPEGPRPLIVLGLCSAVLLLALAVALFVALSLAQGINWAALTRDGLASALGHFLRLAALSALLWGPLLVLGVASLPKRWTKAEW